MLIRLERGYVGPNQPFFVFFVGCDMIDPRNGGTS